jgi:hypothetical protein
MARDLTANKQNAAARSADASSGLSTLSGIAV